jgi:uncharacterized membrane protein HdeD (DUF308 family)
VTARRLPWWFSLAIGVACVLVGAYLIVDPFRSMSALRLAVGLALLLSGAGEPASAGSSQRPWPARAAAAAWLLAGLLVLSLPGLTLAALAAIIGASLLIGGVTELRVAAGEQGEERQLAGIPGVTAAIGGLLALVWPSIIVLGLAVIVGLATLVIGCAALIVATSPVRSAGGMVVEGGRVLAVANGATPPPLPRLAVVAVLVPVLLGAGLSVALHQGGGTRPGPFYAAPSPLPHGPAGTVIRSELVPHFYPGALTYRVLYKSTGFDGRPSAVSGLVVVPEGPAPRAGRRILAFTHPTVGVASDCAPSLQHVGAGQLIQGLGSFLAAGYVVAATDYQGLGTGGVTPDLIGRVEAMNALDSVRAAHRLHAAHAGLDFAVWGASQGGQAALFTGELAGAYAPGLHLVGVAAGAPVPNLIDLFKVNVVMRTRRAAPRRGAARRHAVTSRGRSRSTHASPTAGTATSTTSTSGTSTSTSTTSTSGTSEGSTAAGGTGVGRVLIAMALASWQQLYGADALDRALPASAREAVSQIARHCLYGREAFEAIPASTVRGLTLRHSPPWSHAPWRRIAAENTPGLAPISVPVLITQGDADRVVPPRTTAHLVRRLCAQGVPVQERLYPSLGHLEAGIVVAPDVASWIAERFAGAPAPSSCPG